MSGEIMTEVVERLYTRNYSSLAATGVLLADYLATYESEFAYIWMRPMTPVKIIFLLARYIAIFGQVTNCYLILRVISPDRIPIDEKTCRIAVNYQAWVAVSLHLLSESILIRRVAGLYNYHRVVRFGLITILAIQMMGSVFSMFLEQSGLIWTPACEIVPSSLTLPESIITTVMTFINGLIWFLTTSKRRVSFAVIFPCTSISLRDGAWAALFYLSIFLAVAPYSFLSSTFRTELQLAWPTTLMSIMICRVVLNTREAPLHDDVDISNDPLLDGPCDICQIQDTAFYWRSDK